MTKGELTTILELYKIGRWGLDGVLTAVEAYSSASNNGKPLVSGSLPDIYAGELNECRIEAYTKLHQEYNVQIGTVRDIFCKGADFYKRLVGNDH
jgi:hypothetical protein